MRLKYETKTINVIDYHVLERFVSEVYKATDYDFVATQEGNNDSQYEFNPSGIIEEYDSSIAFDIRSGLIKTYQNSVLFNCLVADGHIPSGTYIVKVSW